MHNKLLKNVTLFFSYFWAGWKNWKKYWKTLKYWKEHESKNSLLILEWLKIIAKATIKVFWTCLDAKYSLFIDYSIMCDYVRFSNSENKKKYKAFHLVKKKLD